jgi:alanine racemase
VGDEVVVLGTQGKQTLSADELAALMGTISYEVTCLIGTRVQRVYID